jgi:hypothetical protein
MSPYPRKRTIRNLCGSLFLCLSLCQCFTLPQSSEYQGPSPRTEQLEDYYSAKSQAQSFSSEVITRGKRITVEEILIQTSYGEIKATYYSSGRSSDDLILVFPLLGGKNLVVDYFAAYFARHGFDAAIIHRNDDFKDPARFDQLEELLRANVLRDRLAMDFFERYRGKRHFGSFGISRGAINAVMTAAADKRLKYNVFALGGSDLARIFKHSNQRRLRRYRESVMQEKNLSEQEFYELLKRRLHSDPKYLAKYIDARNSKLILSLLDKTVPIQFGIKLRSQLGKPETVFLLADHYLGFLYTGIIQILPAASGISLFPFDYIEREALVFYEQRFKGKSGSCALLPFRVVQFPLRLLGHLIETIW